MIAPSADRSPAEPFRGFGAAFLWNEADGGAITDRPSGNAERVGGEEVDR